MTLKKTIGVTKDPETILNQVQHIVQDDPQEYISVNYSQVSEF